MNQSIDFTGYSSSDQNFNLEKLLAIAAQMTKLIVFKSSFLCYNEVIIQTRKFKSKKKRLRKKFRKKYTKVIRQPWEYVIKFDNDFDGKTYIIGAVETIEKLKRLAGVL